MKVETKYRIQELYCLLYIDQFMSTLAHLFVILLSFSLIDCTADLVFRLDLLTDCWYLSAFTKI